MRASSTDQRFFSWSILLTAQHDYQALTFKLLEILSGIPQVNSAAAYEIYNHERKNPGQKQSHHERLTRRFPLNITRNDEDDHNSLIAEMDHNADIKLSELDHSGLYAWVIFSANGGCGPERAIHIEGTIDRETLELLDNLHKIYRNLVVLHDSKERDVLTKLPNRQSLDARLLQVCEHYSDYQIIDKSEQKGSWIAILDIDHFKRVNDNFGHLYGDEVLLTFSQLMEKCFRYNDFLFRFGGEEFVVILNLARQDNAMAAFNRFRESVANYHFPTVGRVTVSIGVTHINNIAMPTTQLDNADKALYFAKENGRNRVVLYEDIETPEHSNSGNETELF